MDQRDSLAAQPALSRHKRKRSSDILNELERSIDRETSTAVCNRIAAPPPVSSSLPATSAAQTMPATTSSSSQEKMQALALRNVFTIEEFADAYLNSSPTSTSTVTAFVSAQKAKPIPIAQVYDPSVVSKFHILCNERRVVPEFDIQEVGTAKFAGTLTVAGLLIEKSGPFPNKKETKMALAAAGIGVVDQVEKPTAPLHEENWMGLISEYCQKTSPSPLNLQMYALGTQFSCEILLSERPDLPLGDKCKPFPSKKEAKQNAAREAVEWLRQEGLLAQASRKRAKPSLGSTLIPEPVPISKGPALEDASNPATSNERIQQILNALALSQPEYRLKQDKQAAGFWSGNVHIARINGPVAQVENIHGKKTAKEECTKQLLAYLEKRWAERRMKAQTVKDESAFERYESNRVASYPRPGFDEPGER